MSEMSGERQARTPRCLRLTGPTAPIAGPGGGDAGLAKRPEGLPLPNGFQTDGDTYPAEF